jgi:RNA polymerase sigma-70 factor (ECF subfamily)
MAELEQADRSAALDEGGLLDGLRRGDEAAFCALVDRHGAPMLRFALLYTRDVAIAEDAVQEVWMAVLRGIERFEGRSSLRTWIFGILLNRIRSRLKAEARMLPFSALDAITDHEATVEPERFLGPDHARWPHHWKTPPEDWGPTPETRLLSQEAGALLADAVAGLPPQQREVITLRDIEGWTADEVCNLLAISESNQRVLLHRARARVRRALANYFAEG